MDFDKIKQGDFLVPDGTRALIVFECPDCNTVHKILSTKEKDLFYYNCKKCRVGFIVSFFIKNNSVGITHGLPNHSSFNGKIKIRFFSFGV